MKNSTYCFYLLVIVLITSITNDEISKDTIFLCAVISGVGMFICTAIEKINKK